MSYTLGIQAAKNPLHQQFMTDPDFIPNNGQAIQVKVRLIGGSFS